MNKVILSLMVTVSLASSALLAQEPVKQPVKYPISVPLSEDVVPVKGCFKEDVKKAQQISNDDVNFVLPKPLAKTVYKGNLPLTLAQVISDYCAADGVVQKLTDSIEVSCVSYTSNKQSPVGGLDSVEETGGANQKIDLTVHSVTCAKVQTCWVGEASLKQYNKTHELPSECENL